MVAAGDLVGVHSLTPTRLALLACLPLFRGRCEEARRLTDA